ncbi:MAG: TolC family protein [Bacteroidia bacterium]|nr:TolC family protein [Bacteroidia bacterium]
MKRILPLLFVLLAFGSYAQEAQSFTLDQCIEYALQNSINAKNAAIDQQIAAARVKETIGIGLPQVSGSASLVHNQKLPRFFGTFNDDPDAFGFFPKNLANAKNGDILAAQNFFQLASSGNASMSISQLIFNGSYFVGLQAASTFKELATKSADQTKEQIILQVTKAYYGVLINKERTTLFTNNISRLDTLLRNTKALYQNGFAESIDVDRIRVAYNNLVSERDKFLNFNKLGTELLKFQMNFPANEQIEVVGKIQEVMVEPNLDSYKEGWDYKNRPDFKTLEVNRRLQELNIKNRYAANIPTIAAFANLGYQTQSNNISGLFKTNSNVESGPLIGPDKWYNFSQFGLSASIPIFSGMQGRYKIQQEKLALQKIDNGFKALKNGIDLDIAQSSITFENAIKSLGAQKENQELAANIARITKIKYEQGVGSNIEVIDAENSLRQAQTNYYGAMFDAMVAKVDLDKAYGKLVPAN